MEPIDEQCGLSRGVMVVVKIGSFLLALLAAWAWLIGRFERDK